MLKRLVIVLYTLALFGCDSTSERVDTTDATDTETTLNTAMENSRESNIKTSRADSKTLGVTPEEFRQRINARLLALGWQDTVFDEFEVLEGEVDDVFVETIDDAIVMVGTVDKNGQLKEVSFIMTKNEEGDKYLMKMQKWAVLTSVLLSPELPKEQTGGAFIKVITKSIEEFVKTEDGQESTVVDGIRYSAIINTTELKLSMDAV